jgi:predicted metal-dependent enzyme (double-stranded beta helix superfamily)
MREDGAMFDLDDFIARCQQARAESEPHGAIREVLDRTLADPGAVATALRPEEAGFTLLHHAGDLTVLHVVWAPGMEIFPHDHRMWAAIGIYTGREDNAFYRRSGPGRRTLTGSGGKRLDAGDTVVLGSETIHSVTNPSPRVTGAIHVYGGDFFGVPRSEWDPQTLEERPYDVAHARQAFQDANDRWLARAAAARTDER